MKLETSRHCGKGRNLYQIFALYLLWITTFVAMTMNTAQAETKPDLNAFGAWPVLHDGRIKTLESFSRSLMHNIAKDTDIHGMDSLAWMANTLFDPASTITMPFIHINKQNILDLPPQSSKYYSMNDVMSALNPHQNLILALEQRDPSMLSASQKELLTVYQSVSIYNQIIQSFSAILTPRNAEKPYMDGGGTKTQRALIAEGGLDNTLLKFIPNDNPSLPMVSLWQHILLSSSDTRSLSSTGPIGDLLTKKQIIWSNQRMTCWI